MKKVAQKLIRIYQKLFSADDSLYHRIGFRKRSTCTFFPSCSEYSYQAFEKYPFFKAIQLSIKRVLRCHPWQKEHFDPLP